MSDSYTLPGGAKIPGEWIDDAQSPDGFRFIATPYGWKKLTEWGARLARWCQPELNLSETWSAHLGNEWHHVYGRGGGKRDDRLVVADRINLRWLCRHHHDKTSIKRREPKAGLNSQKSPQLSDAVNSGNRLSPATGGQILGG